jgi:hypothetical protein
LRIHKCAQVHKEKTTAIAAKKNNLGISGFQLTELACSSARHTAAKSAPPKSFHTKFMTAGGAVGQQLSQLDKELAEEKVIFVKLFIHA